MLYGRILYPPANPCRYRYFTPKMATPKITSTTPVARLRVLASALLAKTAAMRATAG